MLIIFWIYLCLIFEIISINTEIVIGTDIGVHMSLSILDTIPLVPAMTYLQIFGNALRLKRSCRTNVHPLRVLRPSCSVNGHTNELIRPQGLIDRGADSPSNMLIKGWMNGEQSESSFEAWTLFDSYTSVRFASLIENSQILLNK